MLRTLAALSAAALLPLTAAAPAVADTWTHRDAVHDVRTQTFAGDLAAVATPDNAVADITRVAVRHGARSVTVTLGIRDLATRVPRSAQIDIETDGGRRFLASATQLRSRTVVMVGDLEAGISGRPCRGRATTAPEAGVLRVVLPRTCLDRPDWVRVGVTLAAVEGDLADPAADPDDLAIALDSAIGDNAVTRPGRLSPRVERG